MIVPALTVAMAAGVLFAVSATWVSATEDPVVSSWVDPTNVQSARAQRFDIRGWLSWLVPVDVVPGAYVAAEERMALGGRPRRSVLRASLPQLAAGGSWCRWGGRCRRRRGR
ncbi:MAG: hypothetical protein ACKO4U_11955 [Caldilinea sp.]